MSNRRILSLWFPRLGADRLMRADRSHAAGPLAVVDEERNTQVVTSVNLAASQAGVHVGQPVRDAHAMCGGLVARARNRTSEARFLTVLRRWAGKFSPWVAEEVPDALTIDLTGCAHLFGGEAQLLAVIEADCADMELSVRAGIADTLGAAWALARFAGAEVGFDRSGDAIDQEARATRSRAGKRRHWTKGGAAPQVVTRAQAGRIAAPGQSYGALSPLPVAALRLEPDVVAQLNRLGLRRIGDLLGQPRAALARRFGKGLVLRLDQAMGSAAEPVAPAKPTDHFAVRLTLPEPIGLEDDLLAGLDRMLPRLCEKLDQKGLGARAIRLEAHRTDQATEVIDIGLARPSHDPYRMRPLLQMKLAQIDAGFGIDMLRLVAIRTEPLHKTTKTGHLGAGRAVRDRLARSSALDDLLGRIGARVGLEGITRCHPSSSHIPEKAAQTLAAVWSDPARDWPAPFAPRPLTLCRPELVHASEDGDLPLTFRWRGRDQAVQSATGPERIAPEWWLDEPDWRTGVRDYWAVTTDRGERLWIYYGHGAALSPGWFCHGLFG